MKIINILAICLIMLVYSVSADNNQIPAQQESSASPLFESAQKENESSKAQESSVPYKYLNPDCLDKDMEKNSNLPQLFEQEGDRLLKSDNYQDAKLAMRDKTIAKKAIESNEKKKDNKQTWQLIASAAVGAGSMAVAIALLYLFHQKPDNKEISAILAELKRQPVGEK